MLRRRRTTLQKDAGNLQEVLGLMHPNMVISVRHLRYLYTQEKFGEAELLYQQTLATYANQTIHMSRY